MGSDDAVGVFGEGGLEEVYDEANAEGDPEGFPLDVPDYGFVGSDGPVYPLVHFLLDMPDLKVRDNHAILGLAHFRPSYRSRKLSHLS